MDATATSLGIIEQVNYTNLVPSTNTDSDQTSEDVAFQRFSSKLSPYIRALSQSGPRNLAAFLLHDIRQLASGAHKGG